MVFCRLDVLNILKKFKSDFAEKYGIVSIGIFGSAARNELNENSDIDVCIETLTPNPFLIFTIKEELEKLFKRPVDIVRIRKMMNDHLKKRIEKDGVYV